MVTILCLINPSLLCLFFKKIDSLPFCVSRWCSLSLSYMAHPLLSPVGSSRSFLLDWSFLSFFGMSPPLISHAELSIPEFCLVQDQNYCLASTSTIPCREETRQNQFHILTEPTCEIHNCGIGWELACSSKLSTRAKGASVLPELQIKVFCFCHGLEGPDLKDRYIF